MFHIYLHCTFYALVTFSYLMTQQKMGKNYYRCLLLEAFYYAPGIYDSQTFCSQINKDKIFSKFIIIPAADKVFKMATNRHNVNIIGRISIEIPLIVGSTILANMRLKKDASSTQVLQNKLPQQCISAYPEHVNNNKF